MSRIKEKFLPLIKYLIGWPLSVVSLVFIFKLIYSNGAFLFKITSVNYLFLFLGIVFFLFYFILRGITWHEIILKKGNKLSFKKSLYFWEISEIKRYTPGNIWAFVSRSALFTKDNLSNHDMVSSLFNEIVLILLGCFVLSYFYMDYALKNPNLSLVIQILIVILVTAYTISGKQGKKINLGEKFKKIKDAILPGENYFENLKLFAISTLSFLMFAIATYFSAVSVFYIDPRNLTELLSLFVFSLLIGYLSIITPMGLGVREGAMTIGLSSFIPVVSAGFISIFSRVVFMVSEVIFLILVVAWEKIHLNFISKTEDFVLRHKYELAILFFTMIYVLYYTVASFLRYDNFYTGRFDLGNMDQTVWNSLNGRFFQITDPNGTDVISRLSFHADYILVLISPLYIFWSHAKMLLLFQSLVLGLGAFFIFLIAKEVLKNKNIAFVLSLIYLINPAVGFTNLYDFHPVTLATTFLLGCFYFFIKRKYLFFILFAALAGLTKEHVWAVIALFGLVIAARAFFESKPKLGLKNKRNSREILLGIGIFAISSVIFYFLIWQAIPQARGGDHFALEYYAEFGTSASDVLKNVIFSPIKTLSIIFEKDQLGYLFQIFFPLGFLSFLSPLSLVFALPDLGINLLSSNKQLHQIYYQYTAGITPFVFISCIYAVSFLRRRFRFIKYQHVMIYLVLTALYCAYTIGPLPGSKLPNVDMFSKQLEQKNEIKEYLNQIPDSASVAATNNLGSHLSQREMIFTLPIGAQSADYVVFFLKDSFGMSISDQEKLISDMKKDPNYIKEIERNGLVGFRRLTVSQ